jgi:hypothetical protein
MSAPLEQLHKLAEVDHWLAEGACLLAQAEERVQAIDRANAPVGCRLIAAQSLKAMRRTFQLMQDHRVSLAEDIAIVPVAPSVPQAGRWWPLPVRRRAYQPKTL